MASTAQPNISPGYLEAGQSCQVKGVAISFIVVESLATILRVCARNIEKTLDVVGL